jgi:8-oxo-dGTP pyrophosphatase MutT (NUDIX family)
MEYFDLYDKNMNKLNKLMPRGGTNLKGEYFPVVHIWIKNQQGNYLVQQRNKITDPIPYLWATTNGAVLAGETLLEGAIRELHEELGLSFSADMFKLKKRLFVDNDCCNHVVDVYHVMADVLLKDVQIDTVEVRKVAFLSKEEILDMVKNGLFWDYETMLRYPGYFDILESRKK